MTLCCSKECEKRHDCKKHCSNNIEYSNNLLKYDEYWLEDFYHYGFGSGVIVVGNPELSEHKFEHFCGKFGRYKMFEQIT